MEVLSSEGKTVPQPIKHLNLLINTVTFAPDLPSEIVQLARETHTWMGDP
jgi:hypothetical protein